MARGVWWEDNTAPLLSRREASAVLDSTQSASTTLLQFTDCSVLVGQRDGCMQSIAIQHLEEQISTPSCMQAQKLTQCLGRILGIQLHEFRAIYIELLAAQKNRNSYYIWVFQSLTHELWVHSQVLVRLFTTDNELQWVMIHIKLSNN